MHQDSGEATWPPATFENGLETRPFHVRLRAVLDEQGLMHREMAQRLGIHPTHLSRVVRGLNSMSPALALRIEKLTGVPAERLIIWQSLTQIHNQRRALDDAS